MPTVDDRYFDKAGQPVTDVMQWAKLFEDREYQRVRLDTIGEAEVSTVWLGLNHRWTAGAPLIFETMIFGGPHSENQWRWETEASAIRGHEAICAALRAGSDPTDISDDH